MTTPDTPPTVAADEAIANALAPMNVIAEAVSGYHKKLIDGGINDESAGRMAEMYHTTLLEIVKVQMAGAALKSMGMGAKRR